MTIKCIVACWDQDGSPDLFFVKIQTTKEDFTGEAKYRDKAIKAAQDQGYAEEGPVLVYDESDSAGNAMLGLFDWDTALTYSVI